MWVTEEVEPGAQLMEITVTSTALASGCEHLPEAGSSTSFSRWLIAKDEGTCAITSKRELVCWGGGEPSGPRGMRVSEP